MSVSLIDGHIDDDVLTDEQIIKALEWCGCEECMAILNLINRQKAENENLKDILYDADGVNLVNYWHQQCKIVENGCRNFEEENENLKAEIEKLNKQLVFEIKSAYDRGTKAAVEEFAERLTDKADLKVINAFESSWVISQELIDNLVKEMVGDNRA